MCCSVFFTPKGWKCVSKKLPIILSFNPFFHRALRDLKTICVCASAYLCAGACVCCLCVLMIKLSPAGLVIKLKGTEVPSWQQLGLRPASPSCMENARLLHDAMQSHRPQLMNHCSWVLLRPRWPVLAAGLLDRGIRIASDGKVFIILERLDRESLQPPLMKVIKFDLRFQGYVDIAGLGLMLNYDFFGEI